jgi:hypothetical protein
MDLNRHLQIAQIGQIDPLAQALPAPGPAGDHSSPRRGARHRLGDFGEPGNERVVDALFGDPMHAQKLRARGFRRIVFSATTDLPWWQYYCCMLATNTDFVRKYPIATKRQFAHY